MLEQLTSIDMDLHEILRAHDIHLMMAPLEIYIHAFIYTDSRGYKHIIINERLNYESIREAFLHELRHIEKDLDNIDTYIIGFNLHKTASYEQDRT